MNDPFIAYVDQWDALVGEIEALKKKMAPLQRKEMEMRKAIAQRIQEAKGAEWKEGVNNYMLPDLRIVKVGYKLTREIVESELDATREEYRKLNDAPCTFDELLRIKYELNKVQFNKLEGKASEVFARAVNTKPAAPEVKLA